MRAANIVGAVVIVILMIVLLFMVMWYNQNITGAAVSDAQSQQVQQLEQSVQEKNQRIASLQQENAQLKTQLSDLKQEVEDALEDTRQPVTPSVPVTPAPTEVVESTSIELPPGPTDIDLAQAREDLSLSRQQELEYQAILASREDQAMVEVEQKIASIKESNTLLSGKFSQHRITLICRLPNNQLFTVTQGNDFDTGLVWYYDPIDLGTLRSRSVSLTEAKDYEETLTCET